GVLRALRQRLEYEAYSSQTANQDQARNKGGRPPKVNTREETRLLEAWESGQYKTYAELGSAFNLDAEYVQKVIVRLRMRRRRT
ncbi:hypothetical protein, partial [Roseiconus nitratireducens]|uniref:hypothetical protein n=1 Tax=Roseiconus nitratireducens TaxID=2605748 RepID=UPI001F1A2DB2